MKIKKVNINPTSKKDHPLQKVAEGLTELTGNEGLRISNLSGEYSYTNAETLRRELEKLTTYALNVIPGDRARTTHSWIVYKLEKGISDGESPEIGSDD